MKNSNILKHAFFGLLLMLGSACAKKHTTYAPANGAPTPVTPPPAVNWSNPNTVNNVNGQSNLCYVSNTNYFAGQNYQTIMEPVYSVYYNYCSGYYSYYFQGYYYYFSPTQNCAWGPPSLY